MLEKSLETISSHKENKILFRALKMSLVPKNLSKNCQDGKLF